MADGKTHFASNVLLGVGLTLGAAGYLPADAFAPVLAGAVIGTFITPDADVDHTSYPEAALRRIPVVGFVFQVAWFPYALAMPHRGLSHHLVLGTAGRIAYTALMLYAALWLAQHVGLSLAALYDAAQALTWAHVALFVGAWWAQDVAHYVLDAV